MTRDATNKNFLSRHQPQIAVEQTWCSDRPGQEVMHRLLLDHLYPGNKNVFATNIQELTKHTLGFLVYQGIQEYVRPCNNTGVAGREILLCVDRGNDQWRCSVKRLFVPYQCR